MSFLLSAIRTSLSRPHPRPARSVTQLTTTTCLATPSSSSPSLPSPPLVRHARVIVQKRAAAGLYAGKHIQFGNAVSHSHHKTRRTWQPNTQPTSLHSPTLNTTITLHATTHALRCIDKAGGLDAWVMGADRRRLVGKGLDLRERMEAVVAGAGGGAGRRRAVEYEERVRRRAEKAAAAAAQAQQQGAGAAGVIDSGSGRATATAIGGQPSTSAA